VWDNLVLVVVAWGRQEWNKKCITINAICTPNPPRPPHPRLAAQEEDGPGWSCIMYFAVKPETVALFQNIEQAPPGVRCVLGGFPSWCVCAGVAMWLRLCVCVCMCTSF